MFFCNVFSCFFTGILGDHLMNQQISPKQRVVFGSRRERSMRLRTKNNNEFMRVCERAKDLFSNGCGSLRRTISALSHTHLNLSDYRCLWCEYFPLHASAIRLVSHIRLKYTVKHVFFNPKIEPSGMFY